MYILEQFYKKVLKKEPPYYAKYSIVTIVWKPIRKYINVVVIPNVPFSNLRVSMYRWIGFNISKNVIAAAGSLVNKVILENARARDVPVEILDK